MYDAIIIGSGPAGISAALYTIRANIKTLIIGKDNSSLKKTDKIENYYGFENPISGPYLLEQGEKQVRRIGGKIIKDEVIGIEKTDVFKVVTVDNEYEAKSVLIATGQPANTVKISNLKEYEGKGISYCSTCDGFFYKKQKVGVIGYKDFAVHEAKELAAFTEQITIYTDGNKLEISDKYQQEIQNYHVNEKKILRLEGKESLEKIVLDDSSVEEVNGLFIAYGTASSINFALKMGIATKGNSILADQDQNTNIPGLFAAGDCTGSFKQISVAVGQGALAGRQIIHYIRENR